MVRVRGKDSPLEVGDWICTRQSAWGSLTALSQITEIDGDLPGYDNPSARFGYDYVSSESVDSLLKHLSYSR